MSTPLKRIIVFVGNVEKCAAFYRDLFGFKLLKSDHPSDEWLELETCGCRLAFHKARGSKGPIDKPTGDRRDPHKIVFFSKNVPAPRAKLVKREAKMKKTMTFGKRVMCEDAIRRGMRFRCRIASRLEGQRSGSSLRSDAGV